MEGVLSFVMGSSESLQIISAVAVKLNSFKKRVLLPYGKDIHLK